MNATTYQHEAQRTLIDDSAVVPLPARQHRLVWNVVGLAGEAGEAAEKGPHSLSMTKLTRAALRLCEVVKKHAFHERPLDVQLLDALLSAVVDACNDLSGFEQWPALPDELGDVLWYVAALCSILGWDMATLFHRPPTRQLEVIMTSNITKLRLRFPSGWSTAAAARVDVA